MRRVSQQLNVRIAPELREALEAAAEQDRRPVSNLVRGVLAEWIESRVASSQERMG